MSKTYIDRETGPTKVTYTVERPEGGWKRNFDDADKLKLRPIAETLAMLDGNAFFSIGCGENHMHYEIYLAEAHAIYEANGGDHGWAGRASWIDDTMIIGKDAAIKDAYDKLQMLLALKRKEHGNI